MSDRLLMVEDVALIFRMRPQTLRNRQGRRARRVHDASFLWEGSRVWLQSAVDDLLEDIGRDRAKFEAMRDLGGLSPDRPNALAEYRQWEAEEDGQ